MKEVKTEQALLKYGDNKKAGEDFLKTNAKKKDVKTLPCGVQYKVLKEGKGALPTSSQKVKVNYEGRTVDGHVFDSSYQRGEPAVFGVNQVIAGWTEALQLMPEGSKWELYIPYQLAYGEAGAHGAIPPCAALTFVVELIAVL
jgi:FKBP-type peptidyl-prolyl cis-trans isomerase FklB